MSRIAIILAAAVLLAGCKTADGMEKYGDPVLDPRWPAYIECVKREEAKLPPGSHISKEIDLACNGEAGKIN